MTTDAFCYWLNGFFELSNSNTLSSKQVQQIKDHLNLVFNKVTPDRNKKENSKLKCEKAILPIFDLEKCNNFNEDQKYCSNDLGSRKIC